MFWCVLNIKTCFLLRACPLLPLEEEEDTLVANVELDETMDEGGAIDFLAMTTGVGDEEAIESPLPPD